MGCSNNTGVLEDNNGDITGYYKYENTIYANPLSSFLVIKENAADFRIAVESITILHTDVKEQIAASFEKSQVDVEGFAASFMPEVGIPDISVFQQCYQYRINEKYRLYVMDDEICLSRCPRGTMWGIYRLIEVE